MNIRFDQIPVPLTNPLGPREARNWQHANKHVLWGWKRDAGGQSRSVYFSGTINRNDKGVGLCSYFFHYRTKLALEDSSALIGDVERACARFATMGNKVDLRIDKRQGQAVIEFRFGQPTKADEDRVRRLKL